MKKEESVKVLEGLIDRLTNLKILLLQAPEISFEGMIEKQFEYWKLLSDLRQLYFKLDIYKSI